MKKVIFVVTASAAVVGGSPPFDDSSTSNLEKSTREFIEMNDIMPYRRQRKLDGHMYSTRSERLNGGSKSGKGGKDGKSGKSGSGSMDDDMYDPGSDMFRLLPVACPGRCVSSYTNKNFEMIDSLARCTAGINDSSQWWKVHSDGSYVMLESYDTGLCVSVDFEYGDTAGMLLSACNNGIVTLRECAGDDGTQWYFTGGQLISSQCWAAGISSALTVYPDPDNNGKCDGAISVYGTTNDAILRSDTFMFVNRLPESPLDVDDVIMPTLSPTLSPTEEKKNKKSLLRDHEDED